MDSFSPVWGHGCASRRGSPEDDGEEVAAALVAMTAALEGWAALRDVRGTCGRHLGLVGVACGRTEVVGVVG